MARILLNLYKNKIPFVKDFSYLEWYQLHLSDPCIFLCIKKKTEKLYNKFYNFHTQNNVQYFVILNKETQ